MTEYEDDLESLAEQEEQEFEEGSRFGGWAETDDDLEGDTWAERFGTSYVEDRYDVDDIDDEELERLEQEFFDPSGGERGPYGNLEKSDDWE